MNQANPSVYDTRRLLGEKEKRSMNRGRIVFMITFARLINLQKIYSFLITALPTLGKTMLINQYLPESVLITHSSPVMLHRKH